MTFHNYLLGIKAVKKDLKALGLTPKDVIVIHSSDDEGNYFQDATYSPSLMNGEEVEGFEDKKIVICIN